MKVFLMDFSLVCKRFPGRRSHPNRSSPGNSVIVVRVMTTSVGHFTDAAQQSTTVEHDSVARHMGFALGNVVVVGALVDHIYAARRDGRSRKNDGDVVARLACTSRALRRHMSPHVHWARRRALVRHVLLRWRHIALRPWLCTDVPLFGAVRCRPFHASAQPQDPRFGTTVSLPTSNTQCAHARFYILHAPLTRVGDVVVARHVRRHGAPCDQDVLSATFCTGSQSYDGIRHYRWRTIQQAYVHLHLLSGVPVFLVLCIRRHDPNSQLPHPSPFTIDVEAFVLNREPLDRMHDRVHGVSETPPHDRDELASLTFAPKKQTTSHLVTPGMTLRVNKHGCGAFVHLPPLVSRARW